MKILSAQDVHAALRYPEFIDALEEAFAGGFTMPPRQVLLLDQEAGSHDAFALLPSWNDQVIALKAFTYFPENEPPHPSLYSKIMVFDRKHGEPLALVDGTSVTYWRTAGVSALASRLLSRRDAETLVVVGTGNLAPYLIRAHASVRPLRRVLVWGRNGGKARALAARMDEELAEVSVTAAADLQQACGAADLIVCATGSPEILVRGDWVKAGTHTDFLGNHHADQRECDSALVAKARVYVDTKANCFREAGEILVPVREGVLSLEEVVGELAELCRGSITGRRSEEEITLFKSVGCALGDLVGAKAAYAAALAHPRENP